MANGDGPRLLKDAEAVKAATIRAGNPPTLVPKDWGPPALYAGGRWPTASFAYVRDEQLRFALVTTQDWIRTVRHARSDQNMPLSTLGVLTYSTPNTLSELEAGARWPSLPVLLRVSQVLGIEVDLTGPVPE